MAVHDDLQHIGLTEKEAATYLALLELGSASVVAISEKSGLKRTTVYEIVSALTQRGLVSTTAFGKRMRYTAEPPEKLLALKTQELDQMKAVLPTLNALRNVAIEKPALQFFQGRDAIARVFADICLHTDPAKDRILAIETKASTVAAQIGIPFFMDLLAKKRARGLESLTLTTFDAVEIDAFAKQYPWSMQHGVTVKLLSDPQHFFTMSLYLYQNKMALIAADQLVALVVENQRMKQSFEVLFHVLWAAGQPTGYVKLRPPGIGP